MIKLGHGQIRKYTRCIEIHVSCINCFLVHSIKRTVFCFLYVILVLINDELVSFDYLTGKSPVTIHDDSHVTGNTALSEHLNPEPL